MKKTIILILLLLSFDLTVSAKSNKEPLLTNLSKLKDYNGMETADVMIVGTYHFNDKVLEPKQQKSIEKLVEAMMKYRPTKILLEWEPEQQEKVNLQYRGYLNNQFDISERSNEVYQLGFRLAKKLNHSELFLFDDQTDFIGSLENFSFKSFTDYANKNDSGFFDQHVDKLTQVYQHNQKILQQLMPASHIALLNSDKAQMINRHRMHMYEVRVGIQKSWIGPDWLGRWYRRNIRMLGNILKLTEKQDRLLIVVGDNHKWVLDFLVESTPELSNVSSWDYLKDNL